MRYFQSEQYRHHDDVNDIVLVSIINFEHISRLVSSVFVVDFEPVNASWVQFQLIVFFI